MQNVLKPFGEKDTGSLNGRFQRARLRLTLMYVAILAIILFISSGSIYSAFSRRLEHRFERFWSRPQVVLPDGMAPPSPKEVHADLINSLLLVNGFLLLAGGIFSYYLASFTLEPIQAAYDQQRRFLGDASHELRTPLTILQTDLENEVSDENLTGTARIQRESNLEEVRRMGRLVGDLLTLSRFDEDGLVYHEQAKSDVYDVVRTVVTRLQAIAKVHMVSLNIDSLNGGSVEVRANQDFLLQTLMNIVQNAIVYNRPGGSVNIHIASEGKRVRITIADTGIGISKEDLEKIFDRFYRADQSRSRQTGGSGLGLSIVQSLVTHMNGSVDIQSIPEKGTTVTVFLPRISAS